MCSCQRQSKALVHAFKRADSRELTEVVGVVVEEEEVVGREMRLPSMSYCSLGNILIHNFTVHALANCAFNVMMANICIAYAYHCTCLHMQAHSRTILICMLSWPAATPHSVKRRAYNQLVNPTLALLTCLVTQAVPSNFVK